MVQIKLIQAHLCLICLHPPARWMTCSDVVIISNLLLMLKFRVIEIRMIST